VTIYGSDRELAATRAGNGAFALESWGHVRPETAVSQPPTAQDFGIINPKVCAVKAGMPNCKKMFGEAIGRLHEIRFCIHFGRKCPLSNNHWLDSVTA
jgi:hypothetical protein